ncbi:MAG: hypothetical protein IJN17_08650 [Clostridia bacterium]|nr:hypothetical protein [Clostridia bacterium]
MKKTFVFITLILTLAILSTGCSIVTRKNEAITHARPGNETLEEQSTATDESDTTEQTTIQTESETQSVASPEITKSDITGTWMSVIREDNCLYTHTITLNEDGTAQSDGRTLYNSYYMPMQGEEGWYTAPMGFPSDYGTYILNGSKLEITYTRADYGEYEEPYTDTIVISSIKDGKMTVDNRYGVYLRVDTPVTVLSLCETLGVDYSAG